MYIRNLRTETRNHMELVASSHARSSQDGKFEEEKAQVRRCVGFFHFGLASRRATVLT